MEWCGCDLHTFDRQSFENSYQGKYDSEEDFADFLNGELGEVDEPYESDYLFGLGNYSMIGDGYVFFSC